MYVHYIYALDFHKIKPGMVSLSNESLSNTEQEMVSINKKTNKIPSCRLHILSSLLLQLAYHMQIYSLTSAALMEKKVMKDLARKGLLFQ